MEDPTTERWKKLCAQASVETDIDKLIELAREINRVSEEKQRQVTSSKS